jgi:two-component system sensor histidine kinase/response regulator
MAVFFLAEIMSDTSSSIIKLAVTSKTFEQLCSLWSAIAKLAGDDVLLVTEKTLLAATKDTKTKDIQDWEQEKFSLLIMPQFNALLVGQFNQSTACYEVKIAFVAEAIAFILNQLTCHQSKYYTYIQSQIIPQLNYDHNYLIQFTEHLLKVLMNSNGFHGYSNMDNYPRLLNIQPVEKILHHQVEQQRILNQVKIQISQHLDLLEIVQMTIEQVRRLLKIDRLVIYQLDVPINSVNSDSVSTELIDTVTYEARASAEIPSILYFQDEICFNKSSQCKNKYRQGFSLAISDVETGSNLTPCLQSLMIKLQIKAKLVTPLIVQGKLWGFVIAHQCFAPRNWHNSEIRFMRQIADYLAIAIYQNESYQQLQIQKQLLEEQINTKAQQLKDALIAAQVANQSKHDFIGNMSHELRTPLTCIIGLSGTLLHWSLANGQIPLPIEKQQQYLKTIQNSGKQLLTLINNILELSDVESGKYLLNISDFSISNLAKRVIEVVEEEAKKKEIELIIDLQVKLEKDYFCADQERLAEILINLLSNGIKFTPNGGKVILRIWREKQKVIFQVEDTGIGIPEQQIPLLFEKFKQLENLRDRTHNGAGFGLALTKQLVELHGGNIEIESVVEEGSIFTVYLPEVSPKSKLKEQVSLTKEIVNKVKTVVLIAQDEQSATFICQLLTAADYQVVWLIDISMATNQIKVLKPDLIILDQDFPEIDIHVLSKTLKTIDSINSMKVVLLSDRSLSEQPQNLFFSGVDDYLLKSMEADHFLEKIGSLIED